MSGACGQYLMAHGMGVLCLDRPTTHYLRSLPAHDELRVHPGTTRRLLQGKEELR